MKLNKKDYYATTTYTEYVQHINDYLAFMEIFDDNFELAALALKRLAGLQYNPYYIKEILYFTRIWNIIEYIDKVLSMPYIEVMKFKEENKDYKAIEINRATERGQISTKAPQPIPKLIKLSKVASCAITQTNFKTI